MQVQAQQPDPLTLPATPSASKGSYQYGIPMLRFDAAWQLTKGRAHIAALDNAMLDVPELQPGIDGNFRQHLSNYIPLFPANSIFHGTMTAGIMSARGLNGQGISGACPWCAYTLQEYGHISDLAKATASGAVAINVSLGAPAYADHEEQKCPDGYVPGNDDCNALRRAYERDVVVVGAVGNERNGGLPPDSDRVAYPSNFPTVITVGGVEPDGSFWTHGYTSFNPGSNWGPKMRLVAPAKDVLTIMRKDHNFGDDVDAAVAAASRCGDRVDGLVSADRSLPASYSGYGDCTGTSFSAPFVTGLVGLMRSANPLLSAADVQNILYETATQPVAGPAGSGLTFYLPDAAAAVQRALGPNAVNRVTPMFTLYAADSQVHLFTSSPQAAVAAIAKEFTMVSLPAAPTSYQSFGNSIRYYPVFGGKLCAADGSDCTQPPARSLFNVFTTENSPLPGHTLVPLYRMSQVCPAPGPGCKTVRAFAYATSRAQVAAFEAQHYMVDEVEGYLYSPDEPQPDTTGKLCLAFDAARIDYIIYQASICDLTHLSNIDGENTGGNYQFVATLGYAPAAISHPASYQGVWWGGASESGWGLALTQHDATLVAGWYYYDAAGKSTWSIMPGCTWDVTFTTCSGALYNSTGAWFGNYDPTVLAQQQVGTMEFAFSTVNTATLHYTVNGVSGTKNISRLLFGTGTAPTPTDYTDVWWAGAGQNGWGVALAQQQGVLAASWYSYDAQGKPVWFLMNGGTWTSATTFSGQVLRATGSPLIGAAYNPAAFVPVTAGPITLTFSDSITATMTYTVDGVTQTKNISRLAF